MATSTNQTTPSLALLDHGQKLTDLLNSLKPSEVFTRNTDGGVRDIPETGNAILTPVQNVITQMMNELKVAGNTLVQDSRDYVITKIEATLQEFVKLDPTNAKAYGDIANMVKSFKPKMKSHHAVLPSRLNHIHLSEEEEEEAPRSWDGEDSFHEKYDKLEEKEKLCLLCFTLFPDGSEINRRDLINWWVGMENIKTDSDNNQQQNNNNVWEECKKKGQEILDKFVEKGFIIRCSSNRKLHNTYRICNGFHSKLKSKTPDPNPFFLLEQGKSYDGSKDKGWQEKIQAVFNINRNWLHGKISSSISKMKEVKVVHVGKWKQDRSYVTAVDIGDLSKASKNLGHVRYLCLRGISGLVRLPIAIYKLKNLKVLDLRACHNLESLPEGIASLDQLVHLDLSECYLLDHIPKGISKLSNLRVLMGFIIKPDQEMEGRTRNTKKNGSSCAFTELSELKQLRKLTIRTRSVNFPAKEDLNTIERLNELSVLGIAWVQKSTATCDDPSMKFPSKICKLMLQAASNITASGILQKVSNNELKKLYIRGGELENLTDLGQFKEVEEVRLRYLHKLHMDWVQFRQSFPKLVRLEMFGCPNLIDFPCDKNGVWEKSETTQVSANWGSLEMGSSFFFD